ncbi:unnamed protein product, partial [Porites lobata]
MNTVTSSICVLFKKSRQPLMYCSMVALTMGVQEICQQVVFNCPCKRHFEYGLAFLCGPAILLFFLGIFLNDTLCRTGPERDTEKAMTSPVCHYFKSLFTIFYAMTLASVAPVAWLVLSFLQQQYYTCAYFGPPLADRISTATNATDKCHFKLGFPSKEMEETYKTNSQIAGWSLMIIFVLVLVISICISQCMKKGKRLKIPSSEYYRHVEAQEAVEQYHAIALERAKEKAKMYIENLFPKRKRLGGLYSYLKDIGDKVRKEYDLYLDIPPDSHQSTPVDPPQNSP